MKLRLLMAFSALYFLAACASIPSGTPDDTSFDITDYFSSQVIGHGVIERGAKVLGRFDMVVETQQEDGTLLLDETFYFDGREPFNRVWRLTRQVPGVWIGTADNVQGTTTIKIIEGTVYMNYVASFPFKDGMIDLRFNQQLIEMKGGKVLNRSRLSKFGIPVSTVTVIFDKADS